MFGVRNDSLLFHPVNKRTKKRKKEHLKNKPGTSADLEVQLTQINHWDGVHIVITKMSYKGNKRAQRTAQFLCLDQPL